MNPVALAVDDLREQYLREMALVRQTCERTGDGTAAIRRRSAVVDRILIEMWRRAFSGHSAQNVALLALGGYGRKDLFPFSDIDVLFAFADEKTEEQSQRGGPRHHPGDVGHRPASQPQLPDGQGSRPLRSGQSGIHPRHSRSPLSCRPVSSLPAAAPGHFSRTRAQRVDHHHAKARAKLPAPATPSSATPSFTSSPI